MSEPIKVSRWKMVVTAVAGFIAAIGYGYEIMQRDQGVLNIVLFVAFLLVFVFAVHPILTGNTE